MSGGDGCIPQWQGSNEGVVAGMKGFSYQQGCPAPLFVSQNLSPANVNLHFYVSNLVQTLSYMTWPGLQQQMLHIKFLLPKSLLCSLSNESSPQFAQWLSPILLPLTCLGSQSFCPMGFFVTWFTRLLKLPVHEGGALLIAESAAPGIEFRVGQAFHRPPGMNDC